MYNNIRNIRMMRRMTMKELGEKIGVSEAAVSNYEIGKRVPSYEMLIKIAEALDCEVTDLTNPTPNENRIRLTLESEYVELVYAYRKASPEEQKLVKLVLKDYWCK